VADGGGARVFDLSKNNLTVAAMEQDRSNNNGISDVYGKLTKPSDENCGTDDRSHWRQSERMPT